MPQAIVPLARYGGRDTALFLHMLRAVLPAI
jgi:hypothetical protein